MTSTHCRSAVLFTALIGAWSAEAETTRERQDVSSLQVRRTAAALSITQDGQPVLVYNIQSPPVPEGLSKAYHRSGFLHPVRTPRGLVVTDTFPADHPHQHGIFTAWVKTTYDGTEVDFWNLAGGDARVVHSRVLDTFASAERAGFVVELRHRSERPRPVDILREKWTVTVRPTDGSFFCFDLETLQTALTPKPLIVRKHHYGGVALRGPTRWLTRQDSFAKKASPPLPLEPSEFLNDRGSHRLKGNHEHARWVALTGQLEGRHATIAVLCHANNPRAPQAARLHPTKPYFCFAPCVDGEFRIDRQHPYQATYRFLVTDAPPAPDWLDEQWKQWTAPSEP